MSNGRRKPAFWLLAAFFALFVLFLYGPTITIVVLSFQGPSGGLTFPMRGVSFHWFGNLFEKQMVGDFAGSFQRSMILGLDFQGGFDQQWLAIPPGDAEFPIPAGLEVASRGDEMVTVFTTGGEGPNGMLGDPWMS